MKPNSVVLSCLLTFCFCSLRHGGGGGGGSSVSAAETPSAAQESCASCSLRTPDQSKRLNLDFVEAVKRHILNRLQMRDRPNITHPIPKAAMVSALRRLHAGKVRDDGRVEIPNFDGQAAFNNEVQAETSEIISFAESGNEPVCTRTSARGCASPCCQKTCVS